MNKFDIGDIVFVSEYNYRSGEKGKNHSFVIVDERQAIDIDYFGFLLSSKIKKETYPYNKKIKKNGENNLYKTSIVKCDDLILIKETEIKFKIGRVSQKELKEFIDVYFKSLKQNKNFKS